MTNEATEKFKKLLIEGDFLTDGQLKQAIEEANKTGKSLEQVIVEKDFMNDSNLGELIANTNQWKFVNLKKEEIDPSILKLIPEKVAIKQKVIAFAKTKEGIKVAMNNPEDTTLLHLLKKNYKLNRGFTNHVIIPVLQDGVHA